MQATVYSIPRSGSTLVYNLSRDIAPSVDWTFTHLQENIPNGQMLRFVVYRDLPDVCASLWKVRHGLTNGDGFRQVYATDTQFLDVLGEVIAYATPFAMYFREHAEEESVIRMRYERFSKDVPRLARIIHMQMASLGVADVKSDDVPFIADKYDHEAMRECTRRLGGWSDVMDGYWHGGHVQDGRIGKWRECFTQAQCERMFFELSGLMRELNQRFTEPAEGLP